MHLIAGDTLKNIESEAEAIYIAAVPTIGAGALHVLKAGEQYILKFAHDLTDEWTHTHRGDDPVGITAGSDITGQANIGGIDPAKLDRLLALLEAQAAPAQTTPDAPLFDAPTGPTPATEASSPGVAVTGVPVPETDNEDDSDDWAAFQEWKRNQGAPIAPSFPTGPASAPTPPLTAPADTSSDGPPSAPVSPAGGTSTPS